MVPCSMPVRLAGKSTIWPKEKVLRPGRRFGKQTQLGGRAALPFGTGCPGAPPMARPKGGVAPRVTFRSAPRRQEALSAPHLVRLRLIESILRMSIPPSLRAGKHQGVRGQLLRAWRHAQKLLQSLRITRLLRLRPMCCRSNRTQTVRLSDFDARRVAVRSPLGGAHFPASARNIKCHIVLAGARLTNRRLGKGLEARVRSQGRVPPEHSRSSFTLLAKRMTGFSISDVLYRSAIRGGAELDG